MQAAVILHWEYMYRYMYFSYTAIENLKGNVGNVTDLYTHKHMLLQLQIITMFVAQHEFQYWIHMYILLHMNLRNSFIKML